MLQVLMSTFVNYISGLPEIKSSIVEDISGKSEVKSTIGNLYFINTDIRNPFFGDSFKNLDKSFAFFDKKIIFARVK